MSIQATISAPFVSYAEGATPGLVGVIGVTVLDAHGNVALPRTTANIIELDAPSGDYQWSAPSAPSVAGEYTIVWDDGAGHSAIEPLSVSGSYALAVPSPPTRGVQVDLQGFINSRQVLYANFGVVMAFLVPQEPIYDPSVPIGPFGEPLDPWATPASGGTYAYASAFASGLLVTRPYGGRGQVRDQQNDTPAGIIAEEELGINILPEDYSRFGPEGSLGVATKVSFWGQVFQIREWRPDGIGSLQRYVVYVTQESGPS